MKTEEFELIGADGLKLFGYSWLPDSDEEPQSVVCLIHGFGEHLGRYEAFAEHFTKNNIPVFAFDLRGHGKSPGKRGHTKHFDLLLDDVENFLKIVRREYNDALIFLYGHSLGGNIAANYLTRKNTSEIAGAVLSAPWFRLAFDPPAFKVKLAKLMTKIYPAYTDRSNVKGMELTKDETIARAYENDPLVHNKITAGLFMGILTNGELAQQNAFKLTIPLLAIHGKDDPLTSWEATQEFVDKAGQKATLKLYEGVKHEPHNDLEKDDILEEVIGWILENSK